MDTSWPVPCRENLSTYIDVSCIELSSNVFQFVRPQRLRAIFTARFNTLSSLKEPIEKDTCETSRSEGPVAKPWCEQTYFRILLSFRLQGFITIVSYHRRIKSCDLVYKYSTPASLISFLHFFLSMVLFLWTKYTARGVVKYKLTFMIMKSQTIH